MLPSNILLKQDEAKYLRDKCRPQSKNKVLAKRTNKELKLNNKNCNINTTVYLFTLLLLKYSKIIAFLINYLLEQD